MLSLLQLMLSLLQLMLLLLQLMLLLLQLMLSCWNETIFMDIKHRLQEGSMDLVDQERRGKMFDSQLVIGVRESYGRLIFCRHTW